MINSVSENFRRAFLVLLFIFAFPLVCSAGEYDQYIEPVQLALTQFGYDPGPVDGLMGPGTRRAISEFRRDSAVHGSAEIDFPLLRALGITWGYPGGDWGYPSGDGGPRIGPNLFGAIYVINERAEVLSQRLGDMTKAEVIKYLPILISRNLNKIDLVFKRPKSIVFVVFPELKVGDVIKTYHTNIIGGVRNNWSKTYEYTVLDTSQTSPMIIINEFETSNPMYLLHVLLVGKESMLALKYTRASQ